jgi:iron(III) transport system substrate-binding protein
MRERKKVVAVTVGVLVLALAGCSSSETDDEETAAPEAEEEASEDGEPAEETEEEGETSTSGDDECSVTSVLASVEGMSGDERREELLAQAEGEAGEITLYTQMAAQTMGEITDAFTEQTGIEFLTFRSGDTGLLTRIVQEDQAGQSRADVVWVGDFLMYGLRDEGLISPYSSPYQEDLIDIAVEEYWTVNSYQIFGISRNTDLVTEEEAPKSYEDLTDERWAGVMAVDAEDYQWYWGVTNHLRDDKGFTQEQLDEYWQAVAANAEFTSSHVGTRAQTFAGEYHIFATDFTNGVERDREELGAPIEWKPPVEPLFATPEAIALICDTDVPVSSVLFMDWVLVEGQEVLRELYFDVTREDLLVFDADTDLRFVDAQEYLAVEDEVIAEFNALQGR